MKKKSDLVLVRTQGTSIHSGYMYPSWLHHYPQWLYGYPQVVIRVSAVVLHRKPDLVLVRTEGVHHEVASVEARHADVPPVAIHTALNTAQIDRRKHCMK
jgi:hypothetical protein